MSVLPAFLDSDFLTPSLSLKYFCFLHAGFAWNEEALRDMVLSSPSGTDIPDASILKEVVELLLFSKGVSSGNNILAEWSKAVINTFAGEVPSNRSDGRGGGFSVSASPSASQKGDKSSPSGSFVDDLVLTSDLVHTEKHLWALLNSPVSVLDTPSPSKNEASHLLKHYRRLLNDSRWRATPVKREGFLSVFAFGSTRPAEDTPFEQELDSFFSTIQVLCVFCRAIVLAHNTFDRQKNAPRGDVTLGRLMQCLPLGIKSDMANALLAALEHCAVNAKRCFKALQVDVPCRSSGSSASGDDRERNTSLSPPSPSILSSTEPLSCDGPRGNLTQGSEEPTQSARERYLREAVPVLPALAVLKTISDQLPIPQSIEETLYTIFS